MQTQMESDMSKTSSEKFFRQCRYQQAFPPNGEGNESWNECWIEEKFAKLGKLIYIGEKRDSVPDAEKFRIITVGDTRRSLEHLRYKQNAGRGHRKHSDV